VLTASDYGPLPIPVEDFQNANPAGWSGNDANNNNKGDNSPWGETGNGKTFNGKLFNSNAPPTNSKFMIVNGDGGGAPADLITPPFSMEFEPRGKSKRTDLFGWRFDVPNFTSLDRPCECWKL
jgi:hypothetical protein